MAAYLEVLGGVPAAAVSEACKRASRSSEPFPPSAGQLLAECEKLAAKPQIDPATRARLERQKHRIDRDSLQGRAWEAYDRANGTKRMWIGGTTAFVESPFPPGFDELAEADKFELLSPQKRAAIAQALSGAVREFPKDDEEQSA